MSKSSRTKRVERRAAERRMARARGEVPPVVVLPPIVLDLEELRRTGTTRIPDFINPLFQEEEK